MDAVHVGAEQVGKGGERAWRGKEQVVSTHEIGMILVDGGQSPQPIIETDPTPVFSMISSVQCPLSKK